MAIIFGFDWKIKVHVIDEPNEGNLDKKFDCFLFFNFYFNFW
jgi:hypothetical protein